jgi:hypothetical protein
VRARRGSTAGRAARAGRSGHRRSGPSCGNSHCGGRIAVHLGVGRRLGQRLLAAVEQPVALQRGPRVRRRPAVGQAAASTALARPILDVRRPEHVTAPPAAGGAIADGLHPSRADGQHTAKPVDGNGPGLFFNQPEPRDFSLAKNRMSRRSGSFLRASPRPFADPASVWRRPIT